jgi:hypothetical protein
MLAGYRPRPARLVLRLAHAGPAARPAGRRWAAGFSERTMRGMSDWPGSLPLEFRRLESRFGAVFSLSATMTVIGGVESSESSGPRGGVGRSEEHRVRSQLMTRATLEYTPTEDAEPEEPDYTGALDGSAEVKIIWLHKHLNAGCSRVEEKRNGRQE